MKSGVFLISFSTSTLWYVDIAFLNIFQDFPFEDGMLLKVKYRNVKKYISCHSAVTYVDFISKGKDFDVLKTLIDGVIMAYVFCLLPLHVISKTLLLHICRKGTELSNYPTILQSFYAIVLIS